MKRTSSPIARRIAAECHAMPLRMLHRVVIGIYDEALRPLGLSAAQLNLLVAVSEMAEPTAAALSSFLAVEKSTVSRDLERMRHKRWIAAGARSRSRTLTLTAAGRRLLARAAPAWQRAQTRAGALMGKPLVAAVDGAAARIRAATGARR